MAARSNITLRYDKETGDYYIVWEPVIIAAGTTKHEALEDLRTAAHFGVDTLVNLKLKNFARRKED
jgi:predicted RNase H-like HicB family nuclease